MQGLESLLPSLPAPKVISDCAYTTSPKMTVDTQMGTACMHTTYSSHVIPCRGPEPAFDTLTELVHTRVVKAIA